MKGLTTEQARQAIIKFGLNQLPEKNGVSSATLFLRQLRNPLALLLIGAITISLVIGDKLDASLIVLILILNTVLGFWQEFKASKELEALKSFEVTFSRVLRDGKEVELPSSEIVPNDIIILESGDKIPADGSIIESYSLSINESILTGESLPVIKSEKIDENLLFFGTTVISGRAKFKVLQTGIRTKFGAIAQNLSEIEDDQTPLEKALSALGKGIGIFAILAAVLIFALRIYQGYEIYEVLLSSIAKTIVTTAGKPSGTIA